MAADDLIAEPLEVAGGEFFTAFAERRLAERFEWQPARDDSRSFMAESI